VAALSEKLVTRLAVVDSPLLALGLSGFHGEIGADVAIGTVPPLRLGILPLGRSSLSAVRGLDLFRLAICWLRNHP
jgi:hypothetical protein